MVSKSVDEKLNNVFEIENNNNSNNTSEVVKTAERIVSKINNNVIIEAESELVLMEAKPPLVSEKHTQEDYKFSRKIIKELVEKGNTALDDLLNVASESESPRAYEVAAALIKNLGELTDKLAETQRKFKELSRENTPVGENDKTQGPNILHQSIFVGSTKELQELIKNNSKIIDAVPVVPQETKEEN